MSTDFPESTTTYQRALDDDISGHSHAEDQIFMLRQEIDLLRRQVTGQPVERLIEGFVHPGVLEEHLARYKFAAEHLSGNVLDMACGPGHGSSRLIDDPKIMTVTGVDLDPETVRYAGLRYRNQALNFHCQNACIPWRTEKFDGIASFETIEHVPAPDEMLKCIVDMLTVRGTFVVSTPVRRRGVLSDRPTWDFHEREWSTDEFVSLLQLFFDDVKVYGQRWALRQNYGPVHLGKSVVRKLIHHFERDASFIESLEFEIIQRGALPAFWIDPTPLHTVCVCRGPHRAADAGILKKLTYG